MSGWFGGQALCISVAQRSVFMFEEIASKNFSKAKEREVREIANGINNAFGYSHSPKHIQEPELHQFRRYLKAQKLKAKRQHSHI